MATITITLAWLRAKQVCQPDLDIFEGEWGDQVTLSRAVLMRAADLGLRTDWLAEQLLQGDALARFYGVQRAAAVERRRSIQQDTQLEARRAEANASIAPHLAQYNARLAEIRAAHPTDGPEHEQAVQIALAAFRRATDGHYDALRAAFPEFTSGPGAHPAATHYWRTLGHAIADELGME